MGILGPVKGTQILFSVNFPVKVSITCLYHVSCIWSKMLSEWFELLNLLSMLLSFHPGDVQPSLCKNSPALCNSLKLSS